MEAARNNGCGTSSSPVVKICIVRTIGFTEAILGAEIQEATHMDPEDVTDTLNSLMSAGFAESIPYYDEVQMDTSSDGKRRSCVARGLLRRGPFRRSPG